MWIDGLNRGIVFILFLTLALAVINKSITLKAIENEQKFRKISINPLLIQKESFSTIHHELKLLVASKF